MSGELLNDGINVFGRDAEGASRGFVVADHTVDEVKAHAQRNPSRLQAILDTENASDKPRSSLVEWLEGEQTKAEAAERQARADALDASLEAEAVSTPVSDGQDTHDDEGYPLYTDKPKPDSWADMSDAEKRAYVYEEPDEYDVASYNIEQVKEFVEAHPDQREAVLQSEEARGDDARVTLVEWLKSEPGA